MPRCLVRWRLLMIKLLAFLLYICTDITNMHEKPFPNVFLTILLFEFFFFSFLFFWVPYATSARPFYQIFPPR
jgi:hypothetical protein